MTSDEVTAFARQYESVFPKLEAFRVQAEALISVLVAAVSEDVYQVSSRCKSIESFSAKAQRKVYTDPLAEMVDLVGIRVVLLFDDDIDLVVNKLYQTFTPVQPIDDKRSDRTTAYKSVHLTFRVGSQRTSLPEWSDFQDIVFEVQVRSLLMHAWAEVSHRLTYKFDERVPEKEQRGFDHAMSALALIDDYFNRFRGISREIHSGEKGLEEQD